jgi:type VI secretion system protein ImpG
MTFNKYFQDELSYLRDLGAEFANDNPNLAPFLARESNDPDVERLLEGFAFLTGRLRQKLDDEVPELTHSLIQLLWPHFMRPIPAMSVVQFEPQSETEAERRLVPSETSMMSRPVDGVQCTFQTSYDVDLVPARVEGASVENTLTAGFIQVDIRLAPQATFETLRLDRLRLYIHGGRAVGVARALYLALVERCRNITVGDAVGNMFELPNSAVHAVGFAPEDGVIPYPDNAFLGYRVLQEYFAFPDKFMFVDLSGLEATQGFSGRQLTFTFELTEPFALASGISADSLALNCTPVINLFPQDTDPISVDQTKTEYRVRAGDSNGNKHDIHSVRKVVGWVQGRSTRVDYQPFEAFHSLIVGGERTYYSIRRKPAVSGHAVDTYVAFVRDDSSEVVLEAETVSLSVLCTNGALADHVAIGHIDQATGSSPTFATFRNIQPVMAQVPPPIEVNLLWPLISNLALNFETLASRHSLLTMLSSFDFRAYFDAQSRRRHELMVEGVREVEAKSMDWIHRGLPARCTDLSIVVEESKLGGEGEAYLFGSVLNRFLDMYANINAFHRVTLRGSERNVVFKWPVRSGHRPTM